MTGVDRIRPALPIPSGAINPLSAQILGYFQEDLRTSHSWRTGGDKARLGLDLERLCGAGPLHRQRGQRRSCAWIIRQNARTVVPARERSQGERALIIRRFRCRWTARRTGRSACSTSRSRWVTRIRSAATRSWMPGLDFRGPRPASTTSRSATMPSPIPGLPANADRGRRTAFGRNHRLYRLWTAEHQSAMAEPGAARSQGELHLGEG